MDFLYLLYSLLRRKWIIISCAVIGIVAGILFGTFRQKEYVSLAQYSTGFTMEKKVKIAQEESYNLYEIDSRFSNVIAAFASDKVLGMLTYKLLLHDLEDSKPFRVLTEEQKKSPAYTGVDQKKARSLLRKKIADLELLSSYDPEEKKVVDLIELYGYDAESLMKKISLERNGRTDFINIFASSENPHLSAFMVNTSGDQLIRFFNYIYGFRTITASGKLDSLAVVKKSVVDSLSERLRKFKSSIGPSTSGEKATAAMQVVAELYKKYQEETRELNRLKAEKKAIDEQIANLGAESTGTAPVSNNREILRLKQRNEDLEREMAGKSEDEKRKMRDEIESNMNKIISLTPAKGPDRTKETEKKNNRRDELVSRKIELENEIIATQINVEQFGREKDRYEVMIRDGGGDDVLVKEMERDLELATKEYETLRQSMQASLDIDVNPENNFKQTQVGMPAEKANPSRRMLLAALAGFLMLILSAGVILLLEFMDNSFKTPQIFERTTGLRLMAALNRIHPGSKPLTSLFQGGIDKKSEEEHVFVENLRKLRYELEHSGRKIFLFTSARSGEGKTMVIEALASSFSIAKRKVLIIDANFSNNELTRRFEAKPVLEQVSLSGANEKATGFASTTSIPQVQVVGCSQADVTPSEVLPSQHILANLSRLSGQYDFILIEAASLDQHPDTRELEGYAEGVVAVFAASTVYRQPEKETVAYLGSLGSKFSGAILNRIEKFNMDL